MSSGPREIYAPLPYPRAVPECAELRCYPVFRGRSYRLCLSGPHRRGQTNFLIGVAEIISRLALLLYIFRAVPVWAGCGRHTKCARNMMMPVRPHSFFHRPEYFSLKIFWIGQYQDWPIITSYWLIWFGDHLNAISGAN